MKTYITIKSPVIEINKLKNLSYDTRKGFSLDN